MACPSGCINGGAQPRPPTGVDPREYATGVTAALAAASIPEDADSALQRVYSLLGAEGVGSQTAKQVDACPTSTSTSTSISTTPTPLPHRACTTHPAPQYFHTGFTDVQTQSAVERSEEGMVNIGSSSMQW